MPAILKPQTFDELSIVLGNFSPRNQSARVIATKAGPAEAPAESARPGFLERFVGKFAKGMFVPDGAEVPDTIDGDGDGAEDYDSIAVLISRAASDISTCWQISSDAARTALVVAAVDTFLANLDDVRDGGDGKVRKAGRKHSAGTIAKMRDMRGAMDTHHAKMVGMLDDEFGAEAMAKAAEDDDEGEPLAAGETPESVAAATDAALKEGE